MKKLLLALMLLLPFTAAYSQKISTTNAVIISATDPTGNACSATSPNLTYGTGNTRNLYTCQSGVYAVSTGSGSVPDADATTKGKAILGAQAPVAFASLGTCASGNRGQRKQLTDLNKGTRTCTLTTGSTYAWVDDDPVAHIERFGADNTGATDSTAAVQAAIDSGYPVRAGDGTFLIDTVYFPNYSGTSATNKSANFWGKGKDRTIFQARTANTVLFQKVATSGVQDGASIGGFSVKAHASGSTGGAIKVTGFRDSVFAEIAGLSTGSVGFYSLLDVAAHPYLAYKNKFVEIRLSSQTGWTTVIYFNNNGNGSASNSNVNSIINPWIVDNTGLSIAIDALRSAKLEITGGLFENNSGATMISAGTSTTVANNWFELNGLDLDYDCVGGQGCGNTGLVTGNYFSTAHNVNFHSTQFGNLWAGNTEAGAQTFTNSPGSSNIKLTATETYLNSATNVSMGELGNLAGTTSPIQTQLAAKVSSITGTANQITVTGTTTPTLSIPATAQITTALGIGVAAGSSPLYALGSATGILDFKLHNNAAAATNNETRLLMLAQNSFSGNSTAAVAARSIAGGNSGTSLIFYSRPNGGGAMAEVGSFNETGLFNALAGAQITSTLAAALTVGANGATNPVLKVNANTASVATGIEVTGAAAGSNVALAAISSGSNESLQLSSKGTGIVLVGDTGTATATAGAATLNTQRGVITSEALTTASGSAYALTLTNSKVTTSSIVTASVQNGTNSVDNYYVQRITPGSGSVTIVIYNNSGGALNGTIKVSFIVM